MNSLFCIFILSLYFYFSPNACRSLLNNYASGRVFVSPILTPLCICALCHTILKVLPLKADCLPALILGVAVTCWG